VSGLEFVAAFESTYLPAHDVDVVELSGHDTRWRADLDAVAAAGVTRLRYPVRWHRIELEPRRYRWRHTDAVLGAIHELGLHPIVDLVHHTSYPRWLHGGFVDSRFGPAYLRFCEAFAARYPWVGEYTLFNEPFATLFLCGHAGVWPPYGRSVPDLVDVFTNVMPAVAEASRMYRDLLPGARHIWVDTCEAHTSDGDAATERHAALTNDRRFLLLDLVLGRVGDESRPFVDALVEAGGGPLLALEPGHVDVLGLDYYAHSEWHYTRQGPRVPSPRPFGLAALAEQYWRRYRLPMLLSETNIRGWASDRASWLKYTLEQCELARSRGVPLEGYCWFPFVDSLDWDSLLARPHGHIDPVGVLWLDEALERHASSMSRAYAMAAAGAGADALPAYRLHPPARAWLEGFLPQMAHWDWQDAPPGEHGSRGSPYPREASLGVPPAVAARRAVGGVAAR
jgi:beta-glucosidase/6-phospho-beta-glucosidase/beta-galactosidase